MKNLFLVLAFIFPFFATAQQDSNSKDKLPWTVEASIYAIDFDANTSTPFLYFVNPNTGFEGGLGVHPEGLGGLEASYFVSAYQPLLTKTSTNEKWIFGFGAGGAAYGAFKGFLGNASFETGPQGNIAFMGEKFRWFNYYRPAYGLFKMDNEKLDSGLVHFIQTTTQFRIAKNLWISTYTSFYSNGGWINISGAGLAWDIGG